LIREVLKDTGGILSTSLKTFANSPWPISVLYNRALPTIVRPVTNCILQVQVH